MRNWTEELIVKLISIVLGLCLLNVRAVLQEQLTRPVLTQAHVRFTATFRNRTHLEYIEVILFTDLPTAYLKWKFWPSLAKFSKGFAPPCVPARKKCEPSFLRKLKALSKHSAVASTSRLGLYINQPSVRGCFSTDLRGCVHQFPLVFVTAFSSLL